MGAAVTVWLDGTMSGGVLLGMLLLLLRGEIELEGAEPTPIEVLIAALIIAVRLFLADSFMNAARLVGDGVRKAVEVESSLTVIAVLHVFTGVMGNADDLLLRASTARCWTKRLRRSAEMD